MPPFKLDDERFAEMLLRMSEADRHRLSNGSGSASDASVAVWMAEELRRHAEQLRLSQSLSERMKQEAMALRAAGAERRRRSEASRRAG